MSRNEMCYRVSPIIRPTCKVRPSVIFEDEFNVSPTLKISPSWEHEAVGAKILREIELPVSGNSAAILETDDLQDIPEDDDMIVLE